MCIRDSQNFIEIMKANGFYEIKMEYTTLNHTVWEDLKNRIDVYKRQGQHHQHHGGQQVVLSPAEPTTGFAC